MCVYLYIHTRTKFLKLISDLNKCIDLVYALLKLCSPTIDFLLYLLKSWQALLNFANVYILLSISQFLLQHLQVALGVVGRGRCASK